MKSYAVFLFSMGLVTTALGQQADERETALRMFEHELLATPCFGRPFYDAMAEALDESAWKNLDARWGRLQAESPRLEVLRGMLAEQQGDFEVALHHYESVKGDDWGAYHRARLHAFLGMTQEARKELADVVSAAKHPWLFREAARGLGEVILLQEGVEAAEKHYAALWEAHPALELRMPLLEPLLALRMELGRGAAWLESMRPPFDPKGTFAPAAAEIDRGILWHWGSQLTQPQYQRHRGPVPDRVDDAVLYGDLLYAGLKDEWFAAASQHPDCGRWEEPLSLEQGFHTLTKTPLVQAESLVRQSKPTMDALASVLSLSANEGGEAFFQTAKALKVQLRERPWLAQRTVLAKADRILSAQERLKNEVFEGIAHPAWQLMSLIMRRQAGEKPETLRVDARALWEAVKPEQRLQVREGGPHELLGGLRKTILEQLSGESSKQGPWCPSFSIVWNLRGGGFTSVMRNRFAFETQKLFSLGTTSPGLYLPPKLKDGKWFVGNLPDLDTGVQLRFVLWLLRDELGLDAQSFGVPGAQGSDFTARALDVLTRGSHEEICRFLTASPQLATLPAKWLLSFRKTIRYRQLASPDPKATLEISEAAVAKIADALLVQRPDWMVTSLVENRPLLKVAALDVGQSDDLLIACSSSIGRKDSAAITALQNWRKLIPTITDDQSLQHEHAEAVRRLGLKALPHALWGLQWQPSLRRQVALASADYMGQHTQRRYLKYLQETIPKLLLRDDQLAFTMDLFPLGSDVDELSLKLLQLFGPELMVPQPGRISEILAHAERHPRMKDLLEAWDIMKVELPRGELPQIYRFVHPVKQAAIVKIMEGSSSSDARLALALLHQTYGDPLVTERLLKENNGALGPLHMLSRMPWNRPPTTQPSVTDTLERAKKIFSELKEPVPAITLAWRIAKSKAEQQMVYDWLRKEVKPEPAFAQQASVMAELARILKLSDQEIGAAEQLNLQLHQDDPLMWIARGITHARAGEEAQAVDSFLAAVRRTKFADAPIFIWDQKPPKTGWLERTVNAGRLNELAAALIVAIENNPPGSAGEFVPLIMEKILQDDEVSETRRLLDVVLARDRHTLLALFDSLGTAARAAEKKGRPDVAAVMARMALRGIWPKSIVPERLHTMPMMNNAPRGVYRAAKSWGSKPDMEDVSADAPIATLLRLALSGEGAEDFSVGLMQDAAQYPEEEQLVSCALVVRARQRQLQADELKRMEKLDPLARMRLAWRLCVHAPSSNVPLRDLAPSLAAGLKESFQNPKLQRNLIPSYQLASNVIPWIERADARPELAELVTLFAEKLNDDFYPVCWRFTAGLAAKYSAPEQAGEINRRWWEHCFRKTSRKFQPVEWFIEAMKEINLLVQDPDNPTPGPFADLANELWRATVQRFSSQQDPPAQMALLLCDALVATGRIEQLKVLQTDMEKILQTDGDKVFGVVRDRIQQGLALLGNDGSGLPSPQIWLKESSAGTTLAWRLALPLKTPSDFSYELFGDAPSSADTWVVPQFMKGTHELELFAGDTPEALRSVSKVSIKNKAGTVTLENLPPAGWLRAVLRNSGNGLSNFGRPLLYCLNKPLLDSTALESAKPPQWEDELVELYGRPLSSPVAIDSSMRLMITEFKKTGDSELLFVAVNDTGDPIGVMPWRRNGEVRPDGSSAFLIEPEMWLDSDGRLKGSDAENPRPSHWVLTTFAESDTTLRRVRLQAFAASARAPAALDQPQVLTAMPVAALDFPILRWRLNDKKPRASFVGDGVLAIYDTTASPWKELLRYTDKELGRTTSLFTLQPDSTWVMIMPDERKQSTCELWQLRCDNTPNPVTLRECPKLTLPFIPAQTSTSPDERSVVFVSAITEGDFQVAWMEGNQALKLLKMKASGRKTSAPIAISWPGADTALIQQSGGLYLVNRTEQGLKLEPSPADITPPTQDIGWVLKRPQIMVQVAKKTGNVLGVSRLPEECIGQPMWWKAPESPVLLQTSQRELIIVRPKIIKTAQ